MRHRERAQKELEEVARLHEVVRIVFGNVCVCVVQLVRLAKVCEWNHAWNQRNASPPEVRCFCATEMTVYRLVRHYRAEKNQIGSEQNVERDKQRISDGNEERPDRE